MTVDGVDRSTDTDSGAVITVGRQSVRDAGRPGYAAVTVCSPAGVPLVEAGAAVDLVAGDRVRHTGTVTDTSLSHDTTDPDRVAVQPCTVMGPLARWGLHHVGDEPWPVESVADRAARLAGLVGLPLVVQGGGSTMVAARDVDRRRAGELLAELAEGVGGFLYDLAGVVYLQALDHRRVSPLRVQWDAEPAGETWGALDTAAAWADDDTGTIAPPLRIPCTAANWQPTWSQTTEVANIVDVEYGPDTGTDRPRVTVTDPASVAAYGPHDVTVSTVLADPGDALQLASLILARAARPQWALSSLVVPWDEAPPELRAQLDTMRPGARCTVEGLPQPAPARNFPGVVEGWTERLDADGHGGTLRTFTLFLSHVAHSLAVPAWDADPPAARWVDLDPLDSWDDDL